VSETGCVELLKHLLRKDCVKGGAPHRCLTRPTADASFGRAIRTLASATGPNAAECAWPWSGATEGSLVTWPSSHPIAGEVIHVHVGLTTLGDRSVPKRPQGAFVGDEGEPLVSLAGSLAPFVR